MSDLSLFLRKNKIGKGHVFYPATKSLCGEDGKPLLWELRPLTTGDAERLRSEHTVAQPIPGRRGAYTQKMDDHYIPALVCAAVVFPDLNDAALQDSYGVVTAEELLVQMLDEPGEYYAFVDYVQKISGFNVPLDDEVEDAKN
ncbi:MAG: hypothetical protein IJK23_10215 [Clostridia bacterium]|nr:hypothetical protein [Clostridia bacterium]